MNTCIFDNKYCLCQYCSTCIGEDKPCIECEEKNHIIWTKPLCSRFEGVNPNGNILEDFEKIFKDTE
jgi:Ni,Fe-hydrogenase I small subunit